MAVRPGTAISLAWKVSTLPMRASVAWPAARRLRTQFDSPYGDTRYRMPSTSTGMTGTVRARPVRRPGTVSVATPPV